MHPEESLNQTRFRAPKAAAIAGIVFSILLITSLTLLLRALPATIGLDDTWLTTSKNALLLSFNLVPFSGIAFLWFMGVLRDRLGEREDQFLATVILGSGLLFLATLFVFAGMTGTIILLYATDPNRLIVSGFYDFGRTFAREILNTYALKMAGVFMFSTSTLFLRTRMTPRWMAYLGYILGAIALLRTHHLDRLSWIVLLFPLWVLLISIYILIDNYRRRSGAGSIEG